MSDRLSDEQVTYYAMPPYQFYNSTSVAMLATEVQERRKQDAEDARVLKRMADILDAIDALHREQQSAGRCLHDQMRWPCPTHQLIHQ